MSALKWMFVCLLTVSLSCSVSEASEEVNVKSGDNVILQCWGPRDAAIELLEWHKPDLESDEFVFFFREMQSHKDYQHSDFHGRVELVNPEMKDGDLSVILKNVTIDDAGTYECHVGKSHSGRSKRATPELINSVTLNVNSVHISLTSEPGNDVTLPCRALISTHITVVEWTRSDKNHQVFLYRDRRSVPDNQHPYYKNWVELRDSDLMDGDASLILKDVVYGISGTYECWVNQRGRNYRTSIINLSVKPGHDKHGGDKHGGDKCDGRNKGGGDHDGYANLGAFLSFALFLPVLVGLVFFYKRKKFTSTSCW